MLAHHVPPRDGSLDDDEVLAVLLQADGERDTGEPGADDEVVDVGGQVVTDQTVPTRARRSLVEEVAQRPSRNPVR